jgi:hypothetical protein
MPARSASIGTSVDERAALALLSSLVDAKVIEHLPLPKKVL